ncbi:MAG: hypothetical protein JO313_09005 [Verrucomicrobia bacterium]|nr:hypothetical protein [Verrucomicrobiota bacterium]
MIKAKHPHVAMILWGFNSAYYSWGILASGGGYVFSASGNHYNAKDVGVANSGAVEELCQILALIQAGILPKSITCSRVKSEICRGKAAMIISGSWATGEPRQSGVTFWPGTDPRGQWQAWTAVRWGLNSVPQAAQVRISICLNIYRAFPSQV